MNIAIEYGVPTDRCGLQLRMGIDKGFFRDEGIDLALRIVFGGPEIAAEVDAGRFKIVGSSVRRGAVQYFVAHPRFGTWQDLVGSSLGALSRGSCSDWFMREV